MDGHQSATAAGTMTGGESPAVASAGLTPEAVAAAVAAVLQALANPVTPAQVSVDPALPGTAAGEATAKDEPLTVTSAEGGSMALSSTSESRLRSSRLWTTIGGIVTLAGGQFAGLPAITQVCITALAGVYLIVRTMQGGRQ